MKRISIDCTEEEHQKVKIAAVKRGISIKELVLTCVENSEELQKKRIERDWKSDLI